VSDEPVIDDNGLRTGLTPRPIPVGPASVQEVIAGLTAIEGTALIDRHGAMDYPAVARAIDAIAAGLEARGVGLGTVVAASAPNSNELILAFFATQRIGAIWLGINRVLAPPEKAALLDDSRASLFLATPEIIAEQQALGSDVAALTIGCADSDLSAMIGRGGVPSALPPVDPYRPAIIGYTSGTTGLPKGVVHSQHGMMAYINGCLYSDQGGQWQFGMRRALSISLTIMNGIIYGPLVALASRGTYVAIDRADAAGIGEWIDTHGVEVLNCTATTLRDLLFLPQLQHLSLKSLKAVAAGGAPVDDVILEAWRERFGYEIIVDYGITESPSGMASSRIHTRRTHGMVGPAHPHLELAIMDEEGRSLPVGETGELCAGPRAEGLWAGVYTGMLGYWRKPDETRSAFHGAWMRTGDMAVMDEHGQIGIVGRKKEMILRGGANIYPAEIERVLNAHERVMEAVVAGVPDERLGQQVAAYVKMRPGELVDDALGQQLRDYCRSQLARYKVPEQWFVVDDIPRNAMNKPQKNLLHTVPQKRLA